MPVLIEGEGEGGGGSGNVAVTFDPHVSETTPLTTSFSTESMPDDLQLGRMERETVVQVKGRLYRIVGRNKVDAADWVLSNMKATLKALRNGEEYQGTPLPRQLRDALLQGDGDL